MARIFPLSGFDADGSEADSNDVAVQYIVGQGSVHFSNGNAVSSQSVSTGGSLRMAHEPKERSDAAASANHRGDPVCRVNRSSHSSYE